MDRKTKISQHSLQKRMSRRKREPTLLCDSLLLIVIFGFFMFAGCERRTNNSQNVTNVSWTGLLQTSRATILNGSWEQAESAWGKLHRDDRRRDHLQEWIQLQVEILERTETDPLKNALRLGAIQQMYFHTEASLAHLDWLKQSIEIGLFKEQAVQQKAQELLRDIQAIDTPKGTKK